MPFLTVLPDLTDVLFRVLFRVLWIGRLLWWIEVREALKPFTFVTDPLDDLSHLGVDLQRRCLECVNGSNIVLVTFDEIVLYSASLLRC